jgi:hypothetical protein
LIDFYLSERNFDLVKKYVQLKREYEVWYGEYNYFRS